MRSAGNTVGTFELPEWKADETGGKRTGLLLKGQVHEAELELTHFPGA